MSEKRFVVENSNNEVSIKDKVKDNYPFVLAYEHIDDADSLIQECLSLVVLLNEQQSEINELKEEMVRLHKMSIELMDRVIPNLRRENEQLKKELKWKREEIKALIEESERDE